MVYLMKQKAYQELKFRLNKKALKKVSHSKIISYLNKELNLRYLITEIILKI
jgi:hypothetical protein